MKAYAYMRVSGKGQVEGDGFVRQGKAIKEYAKVYRLQIVRTFRDEGVSGTKDLDNRPGLAALVETLHGNGAGIVLIECLDRLARDLMVQESILGDFRRKGITVVSVTEPDLLKDEPVRVLLRQMMGAFSQYEKCMIVSKLKGARERAKAQNGRCEGRKPYGHFPGEEAVLGQMRSLRAGGMAWDKIAAHLNELGVKPRTAKRLNAQCRWHATTVQRLLSRVH
jgi:DNA invertase Pin-like site-specific DNA recombinase